MSTGIFTAVLYPELPCTSPLPTNGVISNSSVLFKDVFSYACNTGYTLIGPPTRQCAKPCSATVCSLTGQLPTCGRKRAILC